MGPLVTNEIISESTNLLLAFVIGIGFGFVLEASGFSSSRKLAGVFYGYDTVVLKVFFTAAITAMIGLLFFDLFGWIDLETVYVNPTYLTSAIIGGIIMGAGFIIGGYCPGKYGDIHHIRKLADYQEDVIDESQAQECINFAKEVNNILKKYWHKR
jgi:hypothetical protein